MLLTTDVATRWAAAALLAAGLLVPSAALGAPAAPPARPGPKDKAALRLDADALGKDYLETNFVRAEKKLEQALGLCGKTGCSPGVVAQLYRDLGVVRIGGLAKTAAGKADFAKAIEVDPNVALDPDYATPAMKKIFDELKPSKPEEPKSKPKPEAAEGLGHKPVVEEAVATPLPIFATYKGTPAASKLIVWYKGVGASKWTSLAMAPKASGFAVEIPCTADASEGDLSYFIEALGDGDESLGKDGSRGEPHVVHVRKELEGEAPHLPDEEPPAHCKNVCQGDDCAPNGEAQPRVRGNWFSLSVQQDFGIIGPGVDVCSEQIQVSGGYSCFRASGSQYHGNPIPGQDDTVHGGLSPATTRIMLGYERVIVAGLTLGVRLGVVLRGGGPRADGASVHPFLPVHAEGRIAYYFGSDVFSTSGLRPYLFAGGGFAQVDAHFTTTVHEDPTKPEPPNQTDNPPTQVLDAWRRMGQGFVGGGVGLMYAFTPGTGLFLDARYMRMLPTPGNILSPELGFALGF